MNGLKKLLLLCAVWCFMDQVHSDSASNITEGLPSTSTETYFNIRQYRFSRAVNTNECGKSTRMAGSLKVVGGSPATLGHWPWMVGFISKPAMRPKAQLFCGGTLISSQWILTAAHCFMAKSKRDTLVRLGDLDLDSRVRDGASPIDASIDQIVLHPQFSFQPKILNDIALVRLKKPVRFTDNILPACVLSGQEHLSNKFYNGKECFITGWGVERSGARVSPSKLMETSVRIVSQETCAKQYSRKPDFVINDKVLCAAAPGKDTCQGDSGGPLVFYNKQAARFYLGGVTSGGNGCADPKFSGVYTRVASFISWINQVTGENF